MVNDVLYNVRWVARIQLFLGAYAYARYALWIPKVSKWSIEFLVNKFSASVLYCTLWNKPWMFWWVEQTKNKPLSKHTKKTSERQSAKPNWKKMQNKLKRKKRTKMKQIYSEKKKKSQQSNSRNEVEFIDTPNGGLFLTAFNWMLSFLYLLGIPLYDVSSKPFCGR